MIAFSLQSYGGVSKCIVWNTVKKVAPSSTPPVWLLWTRSRHHSLSSLPRISSRIDKYWSAFEGQSGSLLEQLMKWMMEQTVLFFNQLRVQPATDQLVLKDFHHVISVLCELPSQSHNASFSLRNIKVGTELKGFLCWIDEWKCWTTVWTEMSELCWWTVCVCLSVLNTHLQVDLDVNTDVTISKRT